VFRKYHKPVTAVYRYDITDFDAPVSIGGAVVTPGDVILGDIDGILVIPAAILGEVIEKAEPVPEREGIMPMAPHEGGNIPDLFERYRVFQVLSSRSRPAGQARAAEPIEVPS
jgi:regulator of RNase E activity RraA